MRSLEQLRDKAKDMTFYLEERVNTEKPALIIERLQYLNAMLIQSGECLAEAKYYQEQITHSTITKALTEAYHDKLSASVINTFVKSTAKDYNYLVTMFDRINAAAVHQIDSLRSILSFIKAQTLIQ